MIKKRKSHISQGGYNLTWGGDGTLGYVFSEADKQRMRDNHSDNSGEKNHMFGKHLPKETKQKIRDSMPDRSGENNPFYGKYHIEETKQKWSEQRSGENNPKAQSIILISPEGKEYKLPCYTPFCKEYNLDPSTLCKVLQGKRNHHRGWTGRYL